MDEIEETATTVLMSMRSILGAKRGESVKFVAEGVVRERDDLRAQLAALESERDKARKETKEMQEICTLRLVDQGQELATLRARVAELERAPLAASEPLTDEECKLIAEEWNAGHSGKYGYVRAALAKLHELRPARAGRMPTEPELDDLCMRVSDHVCSLRQTRALEEVRREVREFVCAHVARWAGAEAPQKLTPAAAKFARGLVEQLGGTVPPSSPSSGAPHRDDDECDAVLDAAIRGEKSAPVVPPMPEARSDGRNVALYGPTNQSAECVGHLSVDWPGGDEQCVDVTAAQAREHLAAGAGVVTFTSLAEWSHFCTHFGPVRLPEKAPEAGEELFGWYSEEQSALTGTSWYSRPDGSRVLVTQVSRGREHGSRWDDIACRGPVVKFLGKNQSPESIRSNAMLTRLLAPPAAKPEDAEPDYWTRLEHTYVALHWTENAAAELFAEARRMTDEAKRRAGGGA